MRFVKAQERKVPAVYEHARVEIFAAFVNVYQRVKLNSLNINRASQVWKRNTSEGRD